jgi:CheY-like chemotaxis protein
MVKSPIDSADILLVEDNISDAELTIRALRTKNLANNLLHVKDGALALDYIFARNDFAGRKSHDFPKVILLDLKMPKINGLEVLATLKANEETKEIPIVVLTSSKEDPDISACFRLGVNSYIVKPVQFDDFIKVVSEIGFYWLLVNHPPIY